MKTATGTDAVMIASGLVLLAGPGVRHRALWPALPPRVWKLFGVSCGLALAVCLWSPTVSLVTALATGHPDGIGLTPPMLAPLIAPPVFLVLAR